MLETVFLGAMSACSSLLQSVTGFGFAIVMMAIMPLFLSMEHALAISTILSAILNAVTARASEILWEKGIKPPVFMSGNIDGGDAYNKAVIAEHKDNIFYMR